MIQHLPSPPHTPRVETGAIQFGTDWPGLFIRGDDAITLMQDILTLIEKLRSTENEAVARCLSHLEEYVDKIANEVIVARATTE